MQSFSLSPVVFFISLASKACAATPVFEHTQTHMYAIPLAHKSENTHTNTPLLFVFTRKYYIVSIVFGAVKKKCGN